MADFILERVYAALRELEKIIGFMEGENAHFENERTRFKVLSFRPSDAATPPIGADKPQSEEVKTKQKEKKGECNQKSAETETKKEEKEMIRFSDCKIRKRKNGLYEIRYRRGGINKTWSAMKLREAKKRCLSWLSSENRRRRELAEEGFAPDALIFGDFADNFLYNVKKRMIKPFAQFDTDRFDKICEHLATSFFCVFVAPMV